MNMYLDDKTLTFVIGIYVFWTFVNFCMIADWYHQGKVRLGYFVAFSEGEKINLTLWIIASIFLCLYWSL